MRAFILIAILFLTACTVEGEPIVIPNAPVEVKDELRTVIKVASAYPANSPAGVFLEAFALEVSNLSDGGITAVVYHDNSLGESASLVEMLQDGSVDFALFPIAQDDPFYEIINTPFLLNEENIDDVIDFLRKGETSFSDSRAITYINGGSIGLSTSSMAQNTRQIFNMGSPLEVQDPIEIDFTPATRFEQEYDYRYYADIAMYYDILYFFQSGNSRIDFTEQQLVVNATEHALQVTQEWYEQNVDLLTEKVTVYLPEDLGEYLETLDQSSQAFEGAELPQELRDILELS